MARVIFKNNNQKEFLRGVRSISGLSNEELASICQVSGRTFRDWLRGKFTLSEKALLILLKNFQLQLPKNIEIVNDFWYVAKGAKKGALRRMALYGPPGSLESRRKGGINSQLRRKENPEKYRLLGCNVRKEFKISESTVDFAEVAGIILGDGSITQHQVRITVGIKTDHLYASFISNLFRKVFGEKPSWREYTDDNTIELTLSGVNLVEELLRWGFKNGDKVKQQVDFPTWIWRNIDFQKACARGLMDTDGGCYFHKHETNGLVYRNFGMCFTNHSLPIVNSVAKVLKSVGLKLFQVNRGTQIFIYDFEEIKKYFNRIGSHNPKNVEKFKYYLNQKTHRVFV